MQPHDIICRGSYRLGTACGQCRKCEARLLEVIELLTDEEPCRYDHNGFCQTHDSPRPCPTEQAKEILFSVKTRSMTQT